MGEARSSRSREFILYSCTAPWKINVQPFRMAPRIYYVGNEWVGAFLIDTEEGLILLDTVVFETTYLTLENIRALGFDPHDIRHIMLTHAHMDHAGGAEAIHQLSGAKIWMSREDAALCQLPYIKDMYLRNQPPFNYQPFDVDCYYDYSSPLQFGSVTIQPVLTPGHTPGTVSFLITMPDENGKSITVGMHGGVGPITMSNAAYDEIGAPHSLRQTFIEGCEKLKKYHVDILMASHPAHGDTFKRLGADRNDYHCFVDDTLWEKFLDERIGFIQELDAKEAGL